MWYSSRNSASTPVPLALAQQPVVHKHHSGADRRWPCAAGPRPPNESTPPLSPKHHLTAVALGLHPHRRHLVVDDAIAGLPVRWRTRRYPRTKFCSTWVPNGRCGSPPGWNCNPKTPPRPDPGHRRHRAGSRCWPPPRHPRSGVWVTLSPWDIHTVLTSGVDAAEQGPRSPSTSDLRSPVLAAGVRSPGCTSPPRALGHATAARSRCRARRTLVVRQDLERVLRQLGRVVVVGRTPVPPDRITASGLHAV